MAEDSAASIAQNSDAPAAERYDAAAAVTRRGLANLLPNPELAEVIDFISSGGDDFGKSLQSGNVIPWPLAPKNRGGRGGQSVFLDEFSIVAQGQYWDRPGLLGFDSMRAMVEQTPILNSIMLTRIRQVGRFCRPQSMQSMTGFVVEHVDKNETLSGDKMKAAQELQKFIANCGWEDDPRRRKRLRRDSFSQFMSKSVRDTLTMDAMPIETEFKTNRALGLDGFYALDGSTIRLCAEDGYQGDDEIFALQVIEGQIRTAYTFDDLIYEVRNPRSDVRACGYGYSETEMLIRVVTYLLNTMTYNGSFFDKNSIPRGILHLSGNYSPEDLAAFKRYWTAMCKGIANVHNLPVMVSKDQESKAEFAEIGGQLSEMAFEKWTTFLTSIACAMFGVAPEEISMDSYAADKSSLSGSDTGEKLVSANDKGLRPLLNHYENILTDFVIRVFSPEYCLRFVGLDRDDAAKRFEMRKLVGTWNEERAAEGKEPIKGPLGEMPMNPTFIPVWQQVTGIGQPQEDFGDPDADGAPGDSSDQGADFGSPDQVQRPDKPGAADVPGEAQPAAGGPPGGSAAGGQDFGKSFTPDFGLPPIYAIEV